MKKRALIVVSQGCEDVETVSPIDVLNRVGVEVCLASVDGNPVRAAYGTVLQADCALSDVSGDYDAVICPGGKENAKTLAASEDLRRLLQDYHARGKIVAAICAAPSHVLAESAGLLHGKQAIGDPGFNDRLRAAGAELVEEPVVIDGNIITSQGPGTALLFSLAVARELVGEEQVRPFAEKWGVGL